MKEKELALSLNFWEESNIIRLFDKLTKQISLLFISSMVASVSNYFFQIFMGRSLGPADYGILASLFSLFSILSVPAGVLQTVTAKYTSNFKAHKELGKIAKLLKGLLKRVSLFGLVGFILFIIASKSISSFLHIPSRLPVIITGVALISAIISPIVGGAIQGLQAFGYLGIGMIIGALVKLFSGIFFVYLGLKVNGALLGLILGSLAGILFLVIPLKPIFTKNKVDYNIDFTEIYPYFLPTFIMLLCFMIITNIDLILVKHFFDPAQAGYYAAASIIAKIILYLPGAITLVMFPKTSELYALNKEHRPILKKSLFYGILLCGTALLLFLTIPSLIVKFIFGGEYILIIPLIGIFSSAMCFFALCSILFLYQLSIHELTFLKTLIIGTIAEVILITLFHTSLTQVISILLGVALFLFLSNVYYVFVSLEKKKHNEPVSS